MSLSPRKRMRQVTTRMTTTIVDEARGGEEKEGIQREIGTSKM